MTKLIRTTLLTSALLLFLAATQPLHALSSGEFSASFAPLADDDTAYAAGTRAMNEQHWPDAVSAFDKVINAKGKRTDAALYWKAYSLNKLGNNPLALATCYQLRSQYKSSTWNKDCDALAIDLQANGGHFEMPPMPPMPPVPPMPPMPPMEGFNGPDSPAAGSDEDLKMLALNSLLNQDPARAIPLLRGVLTGNQSPSMKKHALFVLAQSKSPEAEAILRDAATGKMGPELQRQAIQSMAVFQGKRANDTLAEIYRTTSDQKIKKSIISAFFITQDAPRMVELARNEKDLELKRTIVMQLALMHDKAATDYMLELLK
jgi:hypothetical protein